MYYQKNIENYLNREINTIKHLDVDAINKAMNAIKDAWEREADIYTMGNGGSASTASHMVCDFNKGVSENIGKQKYHLHCLSDNTAIMMAIANDIDYNDVFKFQLEGNVKSGDLIIAISGSGNSENIIRAVKYAKEKGAKVIGMSGYGGGQLNELSDYPLHVAIDDMQIAEDVHLIFNHMMMQILSNT